MNKGIQKSVIESENTRHIDALRHDYAALGEALSRSGIDIEKLTRQAEAFEVTVPSWGVGTGGTRFARFPGTGEPRNIFEKVEDCGVINQLSRCTSRVSPHFPWDRVDDFSELKQHAGQFGLSWDERQPAHPPPLRPPLQWSSISPRPGPLMILLASLVPVCSGLPSEKLTWRRK